MRGWSSSISALLAAAVMSATPIEPALAVKDALTTAPLGAPERLYRESQADILCEEAVCIVPFSKVSKDRVLTVRNFSCYAPNAFSNNNPAWLIERASNGQFPLAYAPYVADKYTRVTTGIAVPFASGEQPAILVLLSNDQNGVTCTMSGELTQVK